MNENYREAKSILNHYGLRELSAWILRSLGYRIGRNGPIPYRKQKVIDSYAETPKYLNIGGGVFVRRHWRVLDTYFEWYDYPEIFIDYDVDLEAAQTWPIESSGFDLVYSSHTLEHLTTPAVKHTLAEAARILKPGSGIRINVPDVDVAVRHYESGTISDFARNWVPYRDQQYARDRAPTEYIPEFWLIHYVAPHLVTHFTDNDQYNTAKIMSKPRNARVDLAEVRADWDKLDRADFFNKYCSMVDDEWQSEIPTHRNWFDLNRMVNLLEEAGFEEVIESKCRQSQYPELCADDFDKRPHFSLYVDAVVRS